MKPGTIVEYKLPYTRVWVCLWTDKIYAWGISNELTHGLGFTCFDLDSKSNNKRILKNEIK